jgi:hypothetical protein
MKKTIAILILLVAGCSPWRICEPGQRVAQGGLYTVDPQVTWSGWVEGKNQDWTVDGWSLHQLNFVSALKEGRALWPPLERKKNPPLFRKDMTPHEVVEFVTASLALEGARAPKTSAFKPQAFGSLQGFRFDLEFSDSHDLEMQGLAVGVVHEDRLYLILYRAAKEHYFPKYRESIEKLIASIEMVPQK